MSKASGHSGRRLRLRLHLQLLIRIVLGSVSGLVLAILGSPEVEISKGHRSLSSSLIVVDYILRIYYACIVNGNYN